MKHAVAIAIAGSLVLAAVVASNGVRAAPSSPSSTARTSFFGPPRELVLYGHISSLLRKGGRYELRFDPAFWLGGTTANRAAVEDGSIKPGEAVPNDYYLREEGHRLLTYRVPATARVTVLTNPGGIRSTPIRVSELAQIVQGKNPKRRPLFDKANGLGYWIRIATDTVRSLDQQYQP
jgi:hypothetical protein